MIDRRTGEVWFMSRVAYRNFATKSVLPLGPVLRLHRHSDWGWLCSYRTYAAYIKIVNRRRRPSLLKKRK
jgi:hypothetical protein